MNRVRFAYAACALALLFTAAPAFAVELEERVDQRYDLGAGGSVSVSNVNGAVTVQGWDGDEVRVEAVKKVKAGSRDSAEEAMRRLEVRIDHRGDRLEIDTKLPKKSDGLFDWMFGNHSNANVTYTVSVPRRTDVEVDTVNGKVRIRGVAGRVEAGTTNGGIDMEDVRGSVKAATTNGGIDVELTEVTAGQGMRFSTTNGGIHLTLPRDARVSVDADTTNGGINLDDLSADIRSQSRRHLRADVNGGGPEIELSTTNGGIRIQGR